MTQRLKNNERARNYIFVINNYGETDIATIHEIAADAKYCIYGKEIAPSTGTPHLQGYIMFNNARYFNSVIKMFEPNHVEIAKGSPWDNFVYCSKENNFTEIGERPKGQGKRIDIEKIKEDLDNGANLSEVVKNCNNYQQLRFAETYSTYIPNKRDTKPEIMWIFGPTGVGKTHIAYELLGNDDTWISGGNLRWFDGYNGQKNVIIDDFRKDFCTYHYCLRLFDKYPMRVEVKGGSRPWVPNKIVITCPYNPEDLYDNREDVNQLLRRLDAVVYLPKQGEYISIKGDCAILETKGLIKSDTSDTAQKSGVILAPPSVSYSDFDSIFSK